MTVDDLPPWAAVRLARLLADLPASWHVASVTPAQDGGYVIRLADAEGQDAGAVVLVPEAPAGER